MIFKIKLYITLTLVIILSSLTTRLHSKEVCLVDVDGKVCMTKNSCGTIRYVCLNYKKKIRVDTTAYAIYRYGRDSLDRHIDCMIQEYYGNGHSEFNRIYTFILAFDKKLRIIEYRIVGTRPENFVIDRKVIEQIVHSTQGQWILKDSMSAKKYHIAIIRHRFI